MFGNQLDSINRKKIKDMYSQGQNQMDIFSMSRRMPLLGFFSSNSSDDDFADRLNYKYTVAILIIFAFIVTNKHFGHNQVTIYFYFTVNLWKIDERLFVKEHSEINFF